MEQTSGGVTPADAARGATQHLPDSDLPLLAARWLAEGWDSEALIELAGMSRAEAQLDARRLLPVVLTSLGFDASSDYRSSGLVRYTDLIGWAVRAMNGPFIPYSAAQKVLEVADDEPDTFDGMPGLDALAAALRAHEVASGVDREQADARVRRLLDDLARQLGVGR